MIFGNDCRLGEAAPEMSRLDDVLRRLVAQRACLNRAAALIDGLDGLVLELGLGNGRSYDHLRELFPTRDIYVCERQVTAHPNCIPPDSRLLLGDLRDTLPEARTWLAGNVALLHVDIGTGIAAEHKSIAAEVRPLIMPLLRPGGLLVSDLVMECVKLQPLTLPDGLESSPEPGRYQLYRRLSNPP
jgi:hypothetical protein